MKEAQFWKAKDGKIQCLLCQRKCILGDGSFGFCKVRQNIKGKLYTLNYGYISSLHLDPIEKKPLYHFYPGEKVFSYGTFGCNFKCAFCCNFEISQRKIEESCLKLSPEELVEEAIRVKAKGIAHTYNEPTIFLEYVLDVAKKSKEKGLFNVLVTNGYISSYAIKSLKGLIDAVVIDFKGNNTKFYEEFCGAELSKVKKGALNYLKIRTHIEITNLIVPGKNDNILELKEHFKWVKTNFGKDTPYHLLRFYPSYEMEGDETSLPELENLRKIALEEGLNYVYLGNVFEHEGCNTYCPFCGNLLIERKGLDVLKLGLKEGNLCSKCGKKQNIVV